MSMFQYIICNLANNNVCEFLKCYIKFPSVSAGIKRETIECVHVDGSIGKKEVCVNEDTGERVPCEACDGEPHAGRSRSLWAFISPEGGADDGDDSGKTRKKRDWGIIGGCKYLEEEVPNI